MDLIIDTSGEQLKTILKDNGICYVNQETGTKHLQYLLPEIDKLINKANKNIKDIDNFCVVLGPGSFTGVRIGVSTIKAFSMAYPNKKIIGLNMFELISHSIFSRLQINSKVAIVIKSTATKYYFALISSNGKIEEMKLLTAQAILQEAKQAGALIFSLNQEFLFEDTKASTIVLSTEDYINFIELKIKNEEYISIQELSPIYLALSQAEEELLKKVNANGNN